MLERQAVEIIRQGLKDAGFLWVRKNHGNPYSAGRVDLEALNPHGAFFGIEVKRDLRELKKGITRLQESECRAITEAGGYGMAVCLLKELGDGKKYWVYGVEWFKGPLEQRIINMASHSIEKHWMEMCGMMGWPRLMAERIPWPMRPIKERA